VDDGTPPPSDTAPSRPAKRPAAPKSAGAKSGSSTSGSSKSGATKSGNGAAGSSKGAGANGERSSAPRGSSTRTNSSKAKPSAMDPRRETVDASGAARRRPSTAGVIDPLLSSSVPVVAAVDHLAQPDERLDVVEQAAVVDIEPSAVAERAAVVQHVDDEVAVDPELDSRIDQLLADEPPVRESSLPVDESGRIELPVIVPADADPELDPDTEAAFAPHLPAEPVAFAEPPPDVVVVPMVPTDEPFAGPDEWTDTDGTDGLPSMARPAKRARRLHAPVVMRRGRRPRVRRVTRVVRQVDTWSVFKVALVFSVFLYGVVLTAGVLLWKVAQNTGTVDNVQRFFESFGWKSFTLHGGAIFHQAWVAGLFGVVGLTGFSVLVATLFNLITDLVGGIRVTVLEEEVIAREDRGLGWRRAGRAGRAAVVAADADADATDTTETPDTESYAG